MFNNFTVEGNICKDFEEKIINDKVWVAFSIANDVGENGYFFDVMIKPPSEKMKEYLKKGQRVIISGRLLYNESNNKRYYTVWANSVDLIFTKREKKSGGE